MVKNFSQKKLTEIPKNLLRMYRKRKGFRSQWKLALTSGTAQSRISLIENKLTKPTLQEKTFLAKALNEKIIDVFPKK